jgi:multiple sugar transport system permease protein
MKNTIKRITSWCEKNFGFLAMLPAVICFLLLFSYPVLSNAFYSFTSKNLVRADYSLVGLENYKKIILNNDTWYALKNGLIYSLGSVFGQLFFGFIAALLLFYINRKSMTSLFRNFLLIPWATPFISSIFIWRWILNDNFGILNHIFISLHIIQSPLLWFGSGNMAMLSVIMRTVWFGVPLMMLSILAALKTIPKTQFEAAECEGARWLQVLRYVIIPNIRGVVGVLIILRTIWIFNNFGSTYAMTKGGPGRATTTLPLLTYQTAWVQFLIGKAAALSIVIMLILLCMITLYSIMFRMKEAI